MVAKIFSKHILIGIIFLSILIPLLFIKIKRQQEKINHFNAGSLDLLLKKELQRKVSDALSTYSKNDWNKTLKLLQEVKRECKRDVCDFEIFFNDFLDSLANTVSTNKEFTLAGETLGILYPSNWKLIDIDGDGENEAIVLQRDVYSPDFILLKVIDFQNSSRITSYTLNEQYFSSTNSSSSDPLDLRDITGDGIPEIVIFASAGKGGAHLYIFQYRQNKLELIFKKDNLFYPEYIFSDINNDGILEIIVEGYNPKTGEKIKEILNI